MKILASLTPSAIIAITTSVAVVVIVIVVLLSLFVFKKNKLGKEIKGMDERFSHLHALVIGQDTQIIRRLEVISRVNLLYVDIHSKFLKLFKEVRDKADPRAQAAVNNVKDLLADKEYKRLKEELPKAKDVLDGYEREVNHLNSELLKVTKPEEDCRQASLLLQESYRRVKQDYNIHQQDLQMVAESYEAVFKLIDDNFQTFEEYIDSAQYDEANEILPNIDKIIHELSRISRDLPKLVALVNDVIPDRISSLENAYEIMIQNNFPLHHLTVNVSVREMKETLEQLRTKIKRFETKGIAQIIDDISARIDDFLASFEDEKKAREEFENYNSDTYKNVNEIERRFIKVKNQIPEVEKIYIIPTEKKNNIEEIQQEINKVGTLKRTLDTLVNSGTNQPYSMLANKMKELKEAADISITHIDDFMVYLNSLRTDCESAYKDIYSYFDNLKLAEKMLRDINNDNIKNKYQPTIEHMYELISSVNDLISVKPIDVEKIDASIELLHAEGEKLLGANGEISQEAKMKVLAENAIIYANRYRNQLSDVDASLKQSEDNFSEGKFEEAYRIAVEVLKRLKTVSEN